MDCEIDVRFLQKGDFIKILPGCRVPVDGILVEGSSHVDESMINGIFSHR